jgi:hypothetical protein
VFFAFSGLFFAMTVFVLFRSEQPFGPAAVVAYISSLILTILMLAAPFLGAYFINYYRKLHQIEEAILLLSEKIDPPPDSSSVSDGDLEHPTGVSAVTVIEPPSPAPTGNDSASVNDNSQQIASNETAINTEIRQLIPSDDAPERNRMPTAEKVSKTIDTDELSNQMSLFGSWSGETSKNAMVDNSSDEVLQDDTNNLDINKVDASTLIRAYVLLNDGESLYVRGKSPLSMKKGRKMEVIDVGVYELTIEKLKKETEIHFMLNDKTKSIDNPIKILSGTDNECYPEF